jgi:hypothetical protein
LDGVVLDELERLLFFSDLATLNEWTQTQGWEVETADLRVLHDLDATEEWSEHPSPDTVDCVALLNAWNLFLDIRASVEQHNVLRDDPENNHIYDKLFYGNNLPSITPPGKHYTPIWSDKEVARLSRIITEGLRLFRARVKSVLPGASA